MLRSSPIAELWRVILVGALCAVMTPFTVAAQDKASELDVSEAQDFLGLWKISMEFGDMTLEFSSIDGKLAAVLNSDQMSEAQTIVDIAKSDDGLKLAFDSDFGPLILDVKLEDAELVGTLGSVAGDFSVELSGSKETGEEEADAPTTRRRRRVRPTATIERGERTIIVGYNELPVDGPDFANLENVGVGDIVPFTMSNPLKLRTEENLKFGDALIKIGNVAEGYPGVYSLWLKRTADGWSIVFNSFPDVWGTQHDPQADVAEHPLTYGTSDKVTETLVVELIAMEDSGNLNIAWGPHRWATPFDVVISAN